MDRTKQIIDRQRRINRGAIAESTLRDLQEVFADVERVLLEDFIKNSRQGGDLDKGTGYRLVALDDVKKIFKEHIDLGRKSAKARQKELESQKNAGGSEI